MNSSPSTFTAPLALLFWNALSYASITCSSVSGSMVIPMPPSCCDGLMTIFLYLLKNLMASIALPRACCLGTSISALLSTRFVRYFLFAMVVPGEGVSGVTVLIMNQCFPWYVNLASRLRTTISYSIPSSSAASR